MRGYAHVSCGVLMNAEPTFHIKKNIYISILLYSDFPDPPPLLIIRDAHESVSHFFWGIHPLVTAVTYNRRLKPKVRVRVVIITAGTVVVTRRVILVPVLGVLLDILRQLPKVHGPSQDSADATETLAKL